MCASAIPLIAVADELGRGVAALPVVDDLDVGVAGTGSPQLGTHGEVAHRGRRAGAGSGAVDGAVAVAVHLGVGAVAAQTCQSVTQQFSLQVISVVVCGKLL